MKHKRIITTINARPQSDLPMPGAFERRRTVAYIRVSTSSEEQLNSYEAQKDYFPKFIVSHSNWEYIGLYCDEGLSGTSSKSRPEFNRMVADALDGKIDLIVTKSISRFARNTLDTLTYVRRLKEVGCEVWFEKENLYSMDSKGEFILTLLSSMAQEESRSLSENVKWGVRKRFSDGKYSLPYAQFLGYQRGEDGKPEIIEDEARIVRLIYRLYLEGDSVSGIAKYLVGRGIPTPGGKKVWQPCVIKSILTNEKYYGAALLQKRFVEDYLTKKARKNIGELPQFFIEDDHAPIVSEEVFMEVQRRLESETYINPCLHAFSNMLICGVCQGKYGSKQASAYKEPRPGCVRHTIWYCNHKYSTPHEKTAPTMANEVARHLFGKAVLQLWSERPLLQAMVKKGVRGVLPREKRPARIREIDTFLEGFERSYPRELSVDKAAVQVMLERGEVTPERMIHFHFINGECITEHIPSMTKLPSRNQ
jgi:site-specific DNA recombinase